MTRAIGICSIVVAVVVVIYGFHEQSRSSDSTNSGEVRRGDAEHALPVNVFSTANVGDWTAFRYVTDKRWNAILLWEIKSVDGSHAVVQVHGRLEDGSKERTYKLHVTHHPALTIESLESMGRTDWSVLSWHVSTEVRRVGNREFNCHKVTYTKRDPLLPGKRTTTELWLSPEVRGSGIVAEHEVQIVGSLRFEMTRELLGYGTANGTEWGIRPKRSGNEPAPAPR